MPKNRRGSPCGCPYFVGDRKGRPYGINKIEVQHDKIGARRDKI
jgi:hypothetical protein